MNIAEQLVGEQVIKGKSCPITTKGRRRVAGFYAHHFSVSTALYDGDAYLLSVACLPSPPPKEGSYSFTTNMLMKLAESASASESRG